MDSTKPSLTHDEIWDDSVLIDSWNEALDEYKKYHSIYARGGSLEGVDISSKSRKSGGSQNPDGNAGVGGTDVDAVESQPEENNSNDAQSDDHQPKISGNPAAPAIPPQAVLGSIRDEGLKKLLMSWYYAGYYTGLYEGQQQAAQGSNAQ